MRKFSDYFRIFVNYILSLQKIGCTRQSESKLSLHSFALSLQNIERYTAILKKIILP